MEKKKGKSKFYVIVRDNNGQYLSQKLYVARDKDESLYLYEYKPKKYNTVWCDGIGFLEKLDSNLFPEVKWEDEEPTEVEYLNLS